MPIDAAELARRLRLAREACGLSQDDVARHLGVSRPTVTQMEQGNRPVSSQDLDRIAYLVGRSPADFLGEAFAAEDALAALFRAHPEVIEDEGVVEALRRCLSIAREWRGLEELLGLMPQGNPTTTYALAKPRKKWFAVEQGERLARQERRRLGNEAGPIPNVARLLESEGIRAAALELPEEVSGIMLCEPGSGEMLVVANQGHGRARRRFSYAHEYAHVLADRSRQGIVSRPEDRDATIEVRANAFAAAFLLPREGVVEFLEGLGKGRPSRCDAYVFDGEGAQRVEHRSEAGSQEIQLSEVARLARQFGVSREMALYRLRNLGFLKQPELEGLLEQERMGRGRALARELGLELHPDEEQREREEFREGFLGLALDALRREAISRGKAQKLASLVGVEGKHLDALLEHAGMGEGASGGG